jgi:hypothetical protein
VAVVAEDEDEDEDDDDEHDQKKKKEFLILFQVSPQAWLNLRFWGFHWFHWPHQSCQTFTGKKVVGITERPANRQEFDCEEMGGKVSWPLRKSMGKSSVFIMRRYPLVI